MRKTGISKQLRQKTLTNPAREKSEKRMGEQKLSRKKLEVDRQRGILFVKIINVNTCNMLAIYDNLNVPRDINSMLRRIAHQSKTRGCNILLS
ncbi:hypothetical protein RND71_017056 [Anisodus tanguticus]|uniref:Uncharacterized protein n=1 Tax=Anisodus tanguticus TaxID=243964 RepID=A0AAE1S1S9_9SOLA|nr:hypothetical protein RND71_017056 [Anisodus tanguticus]